MGNLDINNICQCEKDDSNIETNFKTQNNDKMLCPFVRTIIYQNYNIENGNQNNTNMPKKKKELNFSKNKSNFDINNYDMNFEYHSTISNKLKNTNKSKSKNNGIFNLNPNINENKNSFSNNIKNDNKDFNNRKLISSHEDENKNIYENDNNQNEENQKQIEEEKMKINGITSYNSDTSNAKTNIDKPKKKIKNGFDIQILGKNCYYVGYFKDGLSDGLGKFFTINSKYLGEFKNDQANGFGIYHNNSNETIYEGNWFNNSQSGYGIEKWSDGSIFVGEYKNGEKIVGTYLWNDGNRYEGEFNRNMFEGFGVYFYSKGKIYLGEWEANKKHGYAEFILDDKFYIGNYLNDQKDGFGMYYLKKEDKLFVGFWKKNKKFGFGKIFHKNKMRFGIWGDENENKNVEWFINDKEAFNYLDNNNLGKYRNFFDYKKEEILNYFNDLYNEEYISPYLALNIFNK